MVGSPYCCFEDSYDVLGLLEENSMILLHDEEDDDYWRFLGPPIYYSSRDRSVALEPLDHTCTKEDVHDHSPSCRSEEVVNLHQ